MNTPLDAALPHVSGSAHDSLKGQAAVVTGSSSGIGRAIALELARAGADVVVHAAHNRAGAEQVRDQVLAMGCRCGVRVADFAVAGSAEQFVHDCWTWLQRVDIWINNAGADLLTSEAADWSFEAKLERLWTVDVLSTIRLSRLIGQRMRSPGGVILNMGWDQAETGMGGDSGQLFATAKGAVMAFTRSLARTLAPSVRVNCLAPGWIKTAWGQQASDHWQQRACREALLGRWGTPEDVAQAARFLVSPAAAFITGQIVAVNGGLAGPT